MPIRRAHKTFLLAAADFFESAVRCGGNDSGTLAARREKAGRGARQDDARRAGLLGRRAAYGGTGKVEDMKLSARNQLAGTVVDVHKGATTSHVVIDVGGTKLFASITNEAVAELGLEKGKPAIAVIKASDVMVAVA